MLPKRNRECVDVRLVNTPINANVTQGKLHRACEKLLLTLHSPKSILSSYFFAGSLLLITDLLFESLDTYLLFRFSLHCLRPPSLVFIFFFFFSPGISLFWNLLVSFRTHICLFKRYQFGSKNATYFSFPWLHILFLFKGMEFCSHLISSIHIFN